MSHTMHARGRDYPRCNAALSQSEMEEDIVVSSHSPTSFAQGVTFAREPSEQPKFLLRTEPTHEFGIALARLDFDNEAYIAGTATEHMIALQHSKRVRTVHTICGRHIENDCGARTFNICPAGIDFTVEVLGPFEGSIVRISPECFSLAKSQLALRHGTLVERINGRDDKLYQMGRLLEQEAAEGHPNGSLFWSSAADMLIRHIVSSHVFLSSAQVQGALGPAALDRLDDYIIANISESLDLNSLAAVVDCERFHFAHRFSATTGVAPHRYVMRMRLSLAVAMIRQGRQSLAEIAAMTGFTDQSHLCRWVRRVYNMRPTDLRH